MNARDGLRTAISNYLDAEFSMSPVATSEELVKAGAVESDRALRERVKARLDDKGTFHFAMQWEFMPQGFLEDHAIARELAGGIEDLIAEMHRTRSLVCTAPSARAPLARRERLPVKLCGEAPPL